MKMKQEYIALKTDYPKYLVDLLTNTYEICKNDQDFGLGAWERVGFELGLFRIFSTESVESSDVLKKIISKSAYPRLCLPLTNHNDHSNIILNTETEEYIKSVMNLNFLNIESNLRVCLWDPIFVHFLQGKSTAYSSEFNLTNINFMEHFQKIDSVLMIKSLFENEIFCPILLIEVSREPFHPKLAHKDEQKLAMAMAASLLRLIEVCKDLGPEFVRNLKVFGLLIGSTGFQILTMIPDFGGKDSKVKSFAMIYRTNRDHLRYDLFNGKKIIPESDEIEDFLCDSNEGCKLLSSHKQVPTPFKSVPLREWLTASCLYHKSKRNSSETVDNYNLVLKQKEDNLKSRKSKRIALYKIVNEIQSRSSVGSSDFDEKEKEKETDKIEPESILAPQIQMQINLSDKKIDSYAWKVLERLAVIIEVESSKIALAISSNKNIKIPDTKTANPDFIFSDELFMIWPHGLNSQYQKPKKSPKHDNDEGSRQKQLLNYVSSDDKNENENELPQTMFWSDNLGRPFVDIWKLNRGNELEVYHNHKIKRSKYFPQLKLASVQGKILHMRLFAILNLDEFVKKNEYNLKLLSKNCYQLITKMLTDLFNALKDLHAAGFVHSDLSPNNVGYNELTRTWQLFDFDSSMKITESLNVTRRCGTEGFISQHFQKTEIFCPIDDYISLVYTCYQGFKKYITQDYLYLVINPILALLSANFDNYHYSKTNEENLLKSIHEILNEYNEMKML